MHRIVLSLSALAMIATLAWAQSPDSAVHQQERLRQIQQEQQLAPEAAQLVQELATADEETKVELRKKLSTVLERQFDASQKRRESEVADIERQLAKLKATLRKRAEARREIIDRRLEQITREAAGLGWASDEHVTYTSAWGVGTSPSMSLFDATVPSPELLAAPAAER